MKVLVWDENQKGVSPVFYPNGIRETVASGLRERDLDCATSCQDGSDQGLGVDDLEQVQVLVYWGHVRQNDVSDETVERVASRVERGELGLVVLHSACSSKLLRRLLRSSGTFKGGWDHTPQSEEIRVCAPQHPIAHGITDFVLEDEELYGAPLMLSPPEVVIFQSFFPAFGRYFPSGLVWTVGQGIQEVSDSGPGQGVGQGEGAGRIFYLRPGHESSSSLADPRVLDIIANAVRWVGKK